MQELITYTFITVVVAVMCFWVGWWIHQFKTATDEWIPIDHPPKSNDYILVARWTDGYNGWFKGYYKDGVFYKEFGAELMPFKATHWMNAPKPPKEDI